MMSNQIWSDDELVVLLAFYFRFPRLSQTDSHLDCQQIANSIGRTPGAVDNQLRNIDFDLIRRSGDRHCSKKLASLLDQYKDNLVTLYKKANQVIDNNSWNLTPF